MTHQDYRILFAALGFLAVIIRDDVAQDKRVLRATSIAKLIESFCSTTEPNAFSGGYCHSNSSTPNIEHLVENYIAALRTTDSASLDLDRPTLIKMYELLVLQKMRHDQETFYLFAQNEVIASNILHLAEERIEVGNRS